MCGLQLDLFALLNPGSSSVKPLKVSNGDMGTIFEELIRKFAELFLLMLDRAIPFGLHVFLKFHTENRCSPVNIYRACRPCHLSGM